MNKGDKVIYIFDPYSKQGGTIDSIMYAEIKKLPGDGFLEPDSYTIHPIRMIYGKSEMHDQIAAENYLYEIGDRKVVRMIFERKLERE